MDYLIKAIVFIAVFSVIAQSHGSESKRSKKCRGDLVTAITLIKDCGQLPQFSFGSITLAKEEQQAIGSKANLKCYNGYTFVGQSTIECLKNAQWSMPFALCLPIVCKTLPKVDNGIYEQLGPGIYGSVATLICNTGYTLSYQPVSYIQCLASGQWSNVDGHCIKDCGLLPKAEFGMYIPSQRYNFGQGAMAELGCDHGYVLRGNKKLECINKDGNLVWSLSLGSCEAIECQELKPDSETSKGAYEHVKGNGRTSGSVAIFKCLDGSAPCTDTIAVCGPDGLWSKTGNEKCPSDSLVGDLGVTDNDGDDYDEAIDGSIDSCGGQTGLVIITFVQPAIIRRVVVTFPSDQDTGDVVVGAFFGIPCVADGMSTQNDRTTIIYECNVAGQMGTMVLDIDIPANNSATVSVCEVEIFDSSLCD